MRVRGRNFIRSVDSALQNPGRPAEPTKPTWLNPTPFMHRRSHQVNDQAFSSYYSSNQSHLLMAQHQDRAVDIYNIALAGHQAGQNSALGASAGQANTDHRCCLCSLRTCAMSTKATWSKARHSVRHSVRHSKAFIEGARSLIYDHLPAVIVVSMPMGLLLRAVGCWLRQIKSCAQACSGGYPYKPTIHVGWHHCLT
jgi:hypothetical protein